MLPSEPKIFHGRDEELSDILKLFGKGTPKIAILGAGGMGKTSLARVVLHHTEITAQYKQNRFFVACDSAANKVELAALIGAHLGLKPGKDLTQLVVQHFNTIGPSFLILDNLETVWEPTDSRGNINEFLSLLTDVEHLALMVGGVLLSFSLLLMTLQITMRGAERPAKVQWTRPFLLPLRPLELEAARQTFIDIADTVHNPVEIDKVLFLTDNMPLAINLLAHLVDSESCSSVLSRWEQEKTSLISDGYDQRSSLDFSIQLSLSSPRIECLPQSRHLLSLLSMLPDGLSDLELVHSRLPINDVLACQAVLIQTALAYKDGQKRLKALVPIREYMHKHQPPGEHLVEPLFKYFREKLELFAEVNETISMSRTVAQIVANFANIQNVLQSGLQPGHSSLKDTIYCICYLNQFCRLSSRGTIPLFHAIHDVIPDISDPRLEAYVIMEFLSSWGYFARSNPDGLVAQGLEHFEHLDEADMKCVLLHIGFELLHLTSSFR
jgi:hypothetical protein